MTIERLRDRFPTLVNSGYATATAASAGLLLVLLLIAGRLLGADDYGRFSYAVAVATIAETIMDVGLGHVTVRTVARDKSSASTLFRHVLGLKLVWVAGGLAVIFVVAPILRRDWITIEMCYLLGVSSAARSYLLSARGLLQGLDRFDLEALIVLFDRVLLLICGAAVLLAGYGVLALGLAFLTARFMALTAASIVVGGVLGPMTPTFDRQIWRDLQAAALPLGFFMIAVNLYNYIDTVILGVMRTDAEIGWYVAAYRIYEGPTYFPSIGAAVITPRLSYLFVHDPAKVRALLGRTLSGAAALGIVLGAGTIWLARDVVALLFGREYTAAVPPLQILAGGAFFVFCTWILHAAAIATNLDRRLLVTTVVGLVANVLLNVLLIPPLGIRGAAAATVLAEALTVALLVAQIRRRLAAAEHV